MSIYLSDLNSDQEHELLTKLLQRMEKQGKHWIWLGQIDSMGNPYFIWSGGDRRVQVRRAIACLAGGWRLTNRVRVVQMCNALHCVAPDCSEVLLVSELAMWTHPAFRSLTLQDIRERY